MVDASAELAKRDPKMRALVKQLGPADLRAGRPKRTHFAELVRAICYQQLAGPAARAIHGRVEALFDGDPTPDKVLAASDEALRGAGLSGTKIASIRDLAQRVDADEVQLDRVARLPDDEIVRELTLVRGIGRWTAHMFLMFQLGRLDVWPVGDYGVRKGYALIYGLPELLTERALEPLGDGFRPYRSVAAWYCWRAVDITELP
jgi:DNA-3-methyladenine glycosylase II